MIGVPLSPDEIAERCDGARAGSPADSTRFAWIEARRGLAIDSARQRRAESEWSRVVVARVREGGRSGEARGDSAEASALATLVRQALAAARVQPRTPEPPGPESPTPPSGKAEPAATDIPRALSDPEIAALDSRGAQALLERLAAPHASLRLDWGELRVVVASGDGRSRSDVWTYATLAARTGRRPGSGFAAASARTLAALDAESILARSRLCEADADGDAPVSRAAPLLLAPEAAAVLLESLARLGFAARSILERTPFVAECDPAISLAHGVTIADAPGDDGLSMPFDFDGVRKEYLALVSSGNPRTVVCDVDLGARLGRPTTGHGLAADDAYPLHPALAAGESSDDALLAAAADGMRFGALEQLRVAPLRGLPFTALARSVRRIDASGRLGAALPPLEWRGSLVEVFQRIAASGRQRVAWDVAGAGLGAVSTPAIALGPLGGFAIAARI